MKHIKVIIFGAIVLLLFILFTSGCNLFEFANPSGSASSCMASGMEKYWDGDFVGAAEDFDCAKTEDPENCDAYLWHAKAVLLTTGHTPLILISSVSDLDVDAPYTPLPFIGWSVDSANVLYQALFVIKEDLEVVYHGDVYCEGLDSSDIALDYASVLAVLGVLMIRDTNVDSAITEDDIAFTAHFEYGVFVFDDIWDEFEANDDCNYLYQIGHIFELFAEIAEIIIIELDVEGIDIDDLDENIDTIDEEIDDLKHEYGC